ncbi:MAG: type II toxin-antitoxin system RelE/ParE family toxin [Verrucomicrobia bacterium]|nr:type II toxin-antitoxin system RelE/ParE family toxin [Verrucomicrobiota bacterium]
MPEYTITFAKSARKELEKLMPQLAHRILARIEGLGSLPRPPGCQKLRGNNALWRIRVGDYRILYEIDDTHRMVDISAIGDRKEIYRG